MDSKNWGEQFGATVEIQFAHGDEPELVKHLEMLDLVVGLNYHYPRERFSSRGIVICAGGPKYLPSAFVLVRLLRNLECKLPVEIWYLGEEEMPQSFRTIFGTLGVRLIDGLQMRRIHPVRRLAGWELKCFALLHSAFAEVILLDADNVPLRDPSFLFNTVEYKSTGAIFWPDYTRFKKGQAVWIASGVSYQDEPEFESGQIVVDKQRCWKALCVAMHLNEHSDWWYRLVHGDKDTFHIAWRKLGQNYSMPCRGVEPLDSTMLQYDLSGELLFQHRNFAKWNLGYNRSIAGFQLERECMDILEDLRRQLSGARLHSNGLTRKLQRIVATLCKRPHIYERSGVGARILHFCRDGTIGEGSAGCELWWKISPVTNGYGDQQGALIENTIKLEVFGEKGLTFTAVHDGLDAWRGAWITHEKSAVTIKPLQMRKAKA